MYNKPTHYLLDNGNFLLNNISQISVNWTDHILRNQESFGYNAIPDLTDRLRGMDLKDLRKFKQDTDFI